MMLKQLLQRADRELRDLDPENDLLSAPEMAAAIIRDAREQALLQGHAKAARIAQCGGLIGVGAARELIAAMLATLPEGKSDLLTIKQAAELANVSERQLYRLSHLHTRVGKAIRIRRVDLRDLGTEFD